MHLCWIFVSPDVDLYQSDFLLIYYVICFIFAVIDIPVISKDILVCYFSSLQHWFQTFLK